MTLLQRWKLCPSLMQSTPANMTGRPPPAGPFLNSLAATPRLAGEARPSRTTCFDPRFAQVSAQGIQRVVEGAKNNDLLPTIEDFLDESQGIGQFWDMRMAAARLAWGLGVGIRPGQKQAGGIGGGDAQGLELGANGRAVVLVFILGFEMELIDGRLRLAHWHANNVAGFGDERFAAIFLPTAEDNWAEQLPNSVDRADLRSELDETPSAFGTFLGAEVALRDAELLSEC